jgi:hypothetical protein
MLLQTLEEDTNQVFFSTKSFQMNISKKALQIADFLQNMNGFTLLQNV